jgi:hypothetical protein
LLKCWKPLDQLHNDKKKPQTRKWQLPDGQSWMLIKMVGTALTYIQFYLCYNVWKLIFNWLLII